MIAAEATPIEERDGIHVKREDLYEFAGIRGGKVRTCRAIVDEWGGSPRRVALVTASSRSSPQAQIVARVAKAYGLASFLHMPQGAETPEMTDAIAQGGMIQQHTPGHNSVICARARSQAEAHPGRMLYIPFGMEHKQAIYQTKRQVASVVDYASLADVRRIVVPVGSGMTLAGILTGLRDEAWNIPVVGVVVGADPMKRLRRWGPPLLDSYPLELIPAGVDYHAEVEGRIGGLALDPIYEAKCLPFLRPGDLLWVVGRRRR